MVVYHFQVYQRGTSNDGGNNDNIKKMDIRHSLVHSVFGKHKTIEYQPGFNSTFFNTTMHAILLCSDNWRLL